MRRSLAEQQNVAGPPRRSAPELPQPELVADGTAAAWTGDTVSQEIANLVAGLGRHFAGLSQEERERLSGWTRAAEAARAEVRADPAPSASSSSSGGAPGPSTPAVPAASTVGHGPYTAPENRDDAERYARYQEARASGAGFNAGYPGYCTWESFVFARVIAGDETVPWPSRRSGNQLSQEWVWAMHMEAWNREDLPAPGLRQSRLRCPRCSGNHKEASCGNKPGRIVSRVAKPPVM